jgi:hypothetical protein
MTPNFSILVNSALESQDKFSVQDIHVVKGLTKPLLDRPAIQALGIISNVNLSSVVIQACTEISLAHLI